MGHLFTERVKFGAAFPKTGVLKQSGGRGNSRLPLIPFLFVFGILALFPVPAADLQNVQVWVAPVEGGSGEEQEYFYTNMRMELVGGGYSLAASRENSDFYMNIRVAREEEGDGPANYVNLALYDSRTDNEIITLSWDYNTLDDMDIWNLYLVFQTMANAPIAKSVVVPDGSSSAESSPVSIPALWHSNWLWVGAAGGADYFFSDRPHLDVRLTVGLDFLDFMGLGAGLGYQANFPLFVDPSRDRYYREIEQSLILPLRLRLLLNTDNLVIEPNGGVQFQFRFPGSYSKEMDHRTRKESLALLPAILGGVDLKTKLGRGALGFGARIIYDIETAAVGLGFSLEYQFGFFPKKPKTPKTPAPVPIPVSQPVEEEALWEANPEETGVEDINEDIGAEETDIQEEDLPEDPAKS
jgi:hypothetical protein